MKSLLILLSLVAFLSVAALIDYQKKSIPMIRSEPAHPVYTISQKDDAIALAKGKTVLKMGPWLYGLYSGAIAFKNIDEAKDFLAQKGYELQKWRIFKLSGDYKLDVSEGVLNKTLALTEEMEPPVKIQ